MVVKSTRPEARGLGGFNTIRFDSLTHASQSAGSSRFKARNQQSSVSIYKLAANKGRGFLKTRGEAF